MTPAAAVVAVEQAIEASWVDQQVPPQPLTPIAWPNVPFDPPNEPWLKVDFLWGDGFMETKDGWNDVVGVLQLGVFGPKDEGDGELLDLAETARAMVNRVRMGDVSFGAASGPHAETQTDSMWRAAVVSVPFVVFEQA